MSARSLIVCPLCARTLWGKRSGDTVALPRHRPPTRRTGERCVAKFASVREFRATLTRPEVPS